MSVSITLTGVRPKSIEHVESENIVGCREMRIVVEKNDRGTSKPHCSMVESYHGNKNA